MTRPRVWVELCCGSAAVTLQLLGGKRARPPISYMGAKTGYAHAVLWAMGLQRGQGADSVLLCDAGPWAHVWAILVNRERCEVVAKIIRGWSSEDPRDLWGRLREEYRGTWDTWDAECAAAFLQINALNRLVNIEQNEDGEWMNTGQGGTCFGGDFATPAGEVAERLEAVAAWLQVGAWAGNGKTERAGFYRGPDAYSASHGEGWTAGMTNAGLTVSGPLAVYPGRAETIPFPEDCSGFYVYLDPPYHGTTGYGAEMGRQTVLELAQDLARRGAVVCISEAVELPLEGWHHVEITGSRRGQSRTFSKQKREFLTLSRAPRWRPERPGRLPMSLPERVKPEPRPQQQAQPKHQGPDHVQSELF